MENQITVLSYSMDDALNKACKYLHVNDVKQITYEVIENDGTHIKVLCKTKDDSSITDNHNGYFKIFYRDGFAYLVVFPPIGHGRPVYEDDVINRMKVLNIPTVSPLYIRDIIERAREIPEKLVAWPKGIEYRAEINVRLSEDKMQAVVNVIPPRKGGADPTADEILFAVEQCGVKYGIDKPMISKVANDKIYKQDIVVANGLRVVESTAQTIKYYFETQMSKPFLFDQSGRVNLKELNFIQEKKQGDVLAEITQGEAGHPGVNVMGETVQPSPIGQSKQLQCANNVALSEDGKRLIALIDGYVIFRNDIVSMQNVVHLDNVDFSTGNIEYDGAVVVEGTIADGFSVKASGSIQVGQCLGRVHIVSDGDVILKSGINANDDGEIECKGNFYTRFIENCKIKVHGNCYVEEAVMNSKVSVDNNLILSGKRAEILGGKAIVGGNILCKKIGSPSGVKTQLFVGVEPSKLDTLDMLANKIEETKKMLDKLQQSLDVAQRKISQTSDETVLQTETENKNKIITLQFRFSDEQKELQRDYNDGKSMLQAQNNRYVVVENTIYNGTEIYFGQVEYIVKHIDLNKIMLRYISEKVVELGFTEETLPECFK